MLEHTGSAGGRLSRRNLIKMAGATGLGLALTQVGAVRGIAEAAMQSEDIGTIINIAATAEAMAVTLTGAVIQGAAGYTNVDGSKGLHPIVVTVLKAYQASEQAHYAFLTKAGAKPLALTFSVPDPKIATDTDTMYRTLESLETAFIAAYMSAAREFAEMQKPDLVKVALQIGGVECEHRALARLFLRDPLPHNLAFEQKLFTQVGEAAAALQKLGFIGGTGIPVRYADFAGSVDTAGVTQLAPT
jgi:hypothetical protein